MKKWIKYGLMAAGLFVFVAGLAFMIIFHLPYQKNQNRLNAILNDILVANGYEYDNYFNEYQSDDLYYILAIKEADENIFVVINDENQLVAKRVNNRLEDKVFVDAFEEKYSVSPSALEVGYENSTMVAALKYVGEEELIYAYYNLNTGELIKAYIL